MTDYLLFRHECDNRRKAILFTLFSQVDRHKRDKIYLFIPAI